ncbi:hypothetical protein AWM75_06885 [Aerococcus urinaehominis]|uniref:Uncharacterized protein n=1 Tax=Aerococcus urinaehominis TaxID=128944 RepID=A0A109RHE1_9LACT|nr:HAD-IIA family hydrolase [Aerococcus urinaehominis]AMB99726.1 hypothetical protein AWM75_06885 [Aerococcus urinaehominis]SDL92055.1 4-nitrophenyl phosphatase [Aerococcus urinaehominis]
MSLGLLIDLDGTLYRGQQEITGARDFVARLNERGCPHLFLTNNATRTHQQAASFLQDVHEIAVRPDQFYTSVDALLAQLDRDGRELNGRDVYVIGAPYLKDSLRQAGAHIYDQAGHSEKETVDLVIMGLDQGVCYGQLAQACKFIEAGSQFYLTNPDVQYPEANYFVPGAGALADMVSQVTGQAPTTCGKPSPAIVDGAIDKLGLAKHQVYILGDNLTTDIQAGINAGVKTIHIGTGVHQQADQTKLGIQADYYVQDYQELDQLWQKLVTI